MSLNLLDLPIEILQYTFIQIPYENLQSLCNTNTVVRSICQDRYFWIQKANHDFGISSEQFDEITDLEPRERYHQIRQKFVEEKIIIYFLKQLFELGMYIRGWQGNVDVYPMSGPETMIPGKQNSNSGVAIALVNLYIIMENASPHLKDILVKIPFAKYQNGNLVEIGVTVWEHYVKFVNQEISGRVLSNHLIATSVYHLHNTYGMIIHNFDINRLDFIC